MARSRWIKAVMASVVSGGLALGQTTAPSAPRPADDPTGRIITVNEPGRPPQKCRVVKWWIDSAGHKVFEVQTLDGGEKMTIRIEPASTTSEPTLVGRLHTLRTTIFHWGKERCPPPDAPLPPVVCDNGCSTCTPGTTIVNTTPGVPTSRVPIITTAPYPSPPVCTTCPPDNSVRRPTVVACDPCNPSTGGSTTITRPWGAPSAPASSGTTVLVTPNGSPTPTWNKTTAPTPLPIVTVVPPTTTTTPVKPPPKDTTTVQTPPVKPLNTWPAPTTVTPPPKSWPETTTITTPLPPRDTKVTTTTPSAPPAVMPPVPPPKSIEPRVVQVDPATLDKTRESWGKPAEPKPLPPPEPKKLADLPKPPPPVPTKPATDLPKPPPPKPAPTLPPMILPHADTTKPDPLLSDPTKFARKPLEEKLAPKGDLPPIAPTKPVQTVSNPPPAVPAAPLPNSSESLGAGSKSIVDSGAVDYTPQPIVTLPPATMGPPPRPPQAPQWQVPQAPQPINQAHGNALEANQGGIPYNAFLPREFTPPAPGTPEQGMMANAFSADTDPPAHAVPRPMAYGPPVGGVFGPPRPPQPMMGGYGPPPHNPMLSPAPYGPTVQLAPPADQRGPTGQGTQVAMLPPPQDRGLMPVHYQTPASQTPAAMSLPQLTATLHDALFPSQRETAAEKLSALDWKTNDEAVRALVQAVHDDPAATVRAACVRALGKMKVNTMPVVGAIRAAKNDKDVRVRTEAEEALSVLAPEK